MGAERRHELNLNKYQIEANKEKELEDNKRLHSCISLVERQLKKKKKIMLSEKIKAS